MHQLSVIHSSVSLGLAQFQLEFVCIYLTRVRSGLIFILVCSNWEGTIPLSVIIVSSLVTGSQEILGIDLGTVSYLFTATCLL